MELFSRFIAFLILVLIFPIILVISILLILVQGKPIFFRQERIGYQFKSFKIYKFRTMQKNSGDLITKINDDRITTLGKILRWSKIDEIPQLINILKGEMRFIGPRPEVPKYYELGNFQFLKKVKPGISDYASIIFRNENVILKNIGGDNPYEKLLPIKLELAKYYSLKKSFLLDLKLVLITLIAVVFPNFSASLFLPNLFEDLPGIEDFINKYR